MTKVEIAQRIAADHNMIASMFSSGEIVLRGADSVILMGDAIRDMRALVQQLQAEANAEAAAAQPDDGGKIEE